MFSRSKYDWVTTQIATTMKFDLGCNEETIALADNLLSTDSVYKDIKRLKKTIETPEGWYSAIYAFMLNSLENDRGQDDLPAGIKRLAVTIMAAIGVKKGTLPNPDLALAYIEDSYRDYGLGELPE